MSFIRTTPSEIDFEGTVGAADRPATRLEVKLGAGWSAESISAWVKLARRVRATVGEPGGVAIDAMPRAIASTAALRFRVTSARPRLPSAVAIPLEYD